MVKLTVGNFLIVSPSPVLAELLAVCVCVCLLALTHCCCFRTQMELQEPDTPHLRLNLVSPLATPSTREFRPVVPFGWSIFHRIAMHWLYKLGIVVLALVWLVFINLHADVTPLAVAWIYISSWPLLLLLEFTRFDRELLKAVLFTFECWYLLFNVMLYGVFKYRSEPADVLPEIGILRSGISAILCVVMVLFDAAPAYPTFLRRTLLSLAVAAIAFSSLRESGLVLKPSLVDNDVTFFGYHPHSRSIYVTAQLNLGVFYFKFLVNTSLGGGKQCLMLKVALSAAVLDMRERSLSFASSVNSNVIARYDS